ncbi:Dicamba O-demethylase, oxygenase component (plasmid) [Ralstonia syzygii]
MFLKNAWYVACTPDEIADKPLGRRICGERMVFYRGQEGKVAALEDFCPHRGAPCRSALCAMATSSAATTA